MRGEHSLRKPAGVMAYGSAPHARGTLGDSRIKSIPLRFSPACAGNTLLEALTCGALPVQPRMRGEHLCVCCVRIAWYGSAPHARGTRYFCMMFIKEPRFSPACAGNTPARLRGPSASPVQPRMRGEHWEQAEDWLQENGSAPHARGTHRQFEIPAPKIRFSPACAGNTRPP